MNKTYYPDEIAKAFCNFIGNEDEYFLCGITNAIYNLLAICENPYNDESYLNFYNLLEKVVENMEDKEK